jgi:hypothetical protein
MPHIIPVKPGTVAPAEKERLQGSGVIVIEHTSPEELAPLLEQTADCCLESLVAKLVAEVVRQVGPNYVVTVKGSVKVEPDLRLGTGNGPPVNADGMLQTTENRTHWSFTNSNTGKWWVFVTGSPFQLGPSSSAPLTQYGLSNPTGIAYLLHYGQSITLTWTGNPPTIRTRGMQPGE